MARLKRLQWDKQGDGDFHISLHRELPAGVTLSSPEVEVHQRTSTKPETWEDRGTELTATATIVDALDPRDGSTVTGGGSRAFRVVITQDPDTQPDVEDEPEPGHDYRIKVIGTRSDTGRPIAREVPLAILP